MVSSVINLVRLLDMHFSRNSHSSTSTFTHTNCALCSICFCLCQFCTCYIHGSSKYEDKSFSEKELAFFQGIYQQSVKNEHKNVSFYTRSNKHTGGIDINDDDDDDFDEPQSRLVRIRNGKDSLYFLEMSA